MKIICLAFFLSLSLSCAELLENTRSTPDDNDSFATADTLEVNSTVSFYIHPKDDIDYFRTENSSLGMYNISIPANFGSLMKLGVTLFDSAHVQIANWISLDDFTLSENVKLNVGTYYTKITGISGERWSSSTVNLSLKQINDTL